jgi:hypothetical protein
MQIIEIHGREEYSRLLRGKDGHDLSPYQVYFECPAARLRVLCPVDSEEPTCLRLTLTRDEVELLPVSKTEWALVNESAREVGVNKGLIRRIGFVAFNGEPE